MLLEQAWPQYAATAVGLKILSGVPVDRWSEGLGAQPAILRSAEPLAGQPMFCLLYTSDAADE